MTLFRTECIITYSDDKSNKMTIMCTCTVCVGLPNTSGLLVRHGVKSSQDANAISCMRKAGAIPLALTNMSELCMWYESSNLVYGRTNNAYHQGRMAGGSSGESRAKVMYNHPRAVFVLTDPFFRSQSTSGQLSELNCWELL